MTRPGLDRTLFWAMVVACFTAALACLGARAVDRAAAQAIEAQHGYYIVRVIAPDGAEGINAAASALGGDERIARAAIMSTTRAAALLGGWSQTPVDSAELPPLRLIEVETAPEGAGLREADINQLLAAQGVTAETIGPPDDGRAANAQRLRRAALLGALALSAVMALIVAMAARALAARRRDAVAVMADLGARRRDACLPVADEAGAAGFAAGVLGALGAGAGGLFFLSLIAPDGGADALRTLVGAADIAPLLAAPFAASLAAGIGARLGAEALYARAAVLR